MNAEQNLIDLYRRNERAAEDISWYANAKQLVRERATAADLPWRTYAAVVAATSPMQRWSTKDGQRFPNLDTADRVIAWHRGQRATAGTLGRNARHSAAILNGAEPSLVLGPKTRAFWRALIGLDDVVLDRWALRAIGWPRETIKEQEVPTAAAPYYAAAAKLNIGAAALQAAVWTQIKREAGTLA